MILIVTNRQDQTADYLILELKKRKADYLRFNTEDFPHSVRLLWEYKYQGIDGHIVISDKRVGFKDYR